MKHEPLNVHYLIHGECGCLGGLANSDKTTPILESQLAALHAAGHHQWRIDVGDPTDEQLLSLLQGPCDVCRVGAR